MTPTDSDRRSRGLALRQARAARVRGIRRRVIGSSLALFVATWMLITLTLVTGHDPALARTKQTAALTTATTSASTPGTTTTTALQTTTTTSSSGTSSLTTSQS